MDLPMPLLAPVTMATLFSKLNNFMGLLEKYEITIKK
jgi:hypothetical protein